MYTFSTSIVCPLCREVTTKHFNQLPKNRLIIQLLELNLDSKDKLNTNAVESNSKELVVQSNLSKNEWNQNDYIKSFFNDIDCDQNGLIDFNELSEALKKGMYNTDINLNKLKVLFNNYNRDTNGRINFNQFRELFEEINEKLIATNYSENLNDTLPRLISITRSSNDQAYGFDLNTNDSLNNNFVTNVFEHLPAYKAGLRNYDYIIEINNESIKNLKHEDIVEKILSKQNTVDFLVVANYESKLINFKA